jgi:leucyl/phenylalanyl-tRNA--protein transferase
MPVYRLRDAIEFPPPEEAEPDGLLAIGGDLRPARLLQAYRQGIFPWYDETQPILWHSPPRRMLLLASELHVPRRLARRARQAPFRLTLDRDFAAVIRGCAEAPRPGQRGTWITPDMQRAYAELHALGYAHSVEAWEGERLVGGLYGVSLGGCFFAESMFTRRPDASKLALVALVEQLRRWSIELIDCQVHTGHMARFGAREWPRVDFLAALSAALDQPTRRGAWDFEA